MLDFKEFFRILGERIGDMEFFSEKNVSIAIALVFFCGLASVSGCSKGQNKISVIHHYFTHADLINRPRKLNIELYIYKRKREINSSEVG